MGLCYFQLDYSDADSEDLPASCLEKFHSRVAKNDPNQIIKKTTKSWNKPIKQKQHNLNKQAKQNQTTKQTPKPLIHPNFEVVKSRVWCKQRIFLLSLSSFPSAQALHN